jgi:hypothetical protein
LHLFESPGNLVPRVIFRFDNDARACGDVFGPERHDRIALLAPRDGAGEARNILNDIAAAAGQPLDCGEHRVLKGEPMSRRAGRLLAPCH